MPSVIIAAAVASTQAHIDERNGREITPETSRPESLAMSRQRFSQSLVFPTVTHPSAPSSGGAAHEEKNSVSGNDGQSCEQISSSRTPPPSSGGATTVAADPDCWPRPLCVRRSARSDYRIDTVARHRAHRPDALVDRAQEFAGRASQLHSLAGFQTALIAPAPANRTPAVTTATARSAVATRQP